RRGFFEAAEDARGFFAAPPLEPDTVRRVVAGVGALTGRGSGGGAFTSAETARRAPVTTERRGSQISTSSMPVAFPLAKRSSYHSLAARATIASRSASSSAPGPPPSAGN